MTTATLATGTRSMDTVDRPRRSLEELVDQLMAAMGFKEEEPETASATEIPSVAKSVHEARRLRQAGDVDGALAVLAGVDAETGGDEGGSVGLLRVDAAGEAAVRRPRRPGLQPGHGTGRRAGAHRRRGDAGGRGGPGDALAARQGRLGAQPPGPAAPERRCVMVTANVDITALKARHPLGDTVEAAGVRLQGKGQGPPGRLPLPRRERGQLHGIRRLGAVLLLRVWPRRRRAGLHPAGRGPERCPRPSRGWTAAQGLRPGPPLVQPERGVPGPPRCLPRDPALLTAAARFYAGGLRRHSRSAGVPGLAGRRPGRRSPPRSRLCAGRRAAAGPGVPRLLREAHPGLRAVHGAGGGAVRRHGRRSRRLRRPRPLARRSGRRPRPDSPLPGPPRLQAGAGSWASRPRPCLGGRGRGTLRLARPYRMGPSGGRGPGHPGHGAGRRSPCAAALASSSPSTPTTRAARRRSGF